MQPVKVEKLWTFATIELALIEDTSNVSVPPFENEKLLGLIEDVLIDEKVIDGPIMLEKDMELALIVQM